MAHDLKNPRTKKYSKLKSLIINFETFSKKFILFCIIILNFVFHKKKNQYIDIENYKDKDSRFINYLFLSLSPKYNFSYDLSFTVTDFIKKIGIKNFLKHATPNFFIKNQIKLKFFLNKHKTEKNELNFNTNYFSKINKDKMFLPYYFYPKVYNYSYNNLKKFKNNIKIIKIFFSGSTNQDVYGKFTWHDDQNNKFLNRVEILNYVIKNFEDKIFFLKNYNELTKIDHVKTPIVLSINDNLIKKTKTNLTNNQHFEIISKSDFLLTAPGADMPLCHHFIEAIKMKSIPISNYAHLHQPEIFQNNYLKFTNFDTLNDAIIKALHMPIEQVLSLQQNLENFYDNKLSPESFLNKFENRDTDEVIACNDVESLKWLK